MVQGCSVSLPRMWEQRVQHQSPKGAHLILGQAVARPGPQLLDGQPASAGAVAAAAAGGGAVGQPHHRRDFLRGVWRGTGGHWYKGVGL